MVAQTAVCRYSPRSSILISQVITLLLLLPGLLVSACVNRAPEGLLGAAIAEVGVHDLLKVTAFSPNIRFPEQDSLSVSW
jgi:hypothetical protein